MRWIPAVLILLVVLVAYGYDRRWTASDEVPAGARVAGVEVGGLPLAEAQERIDAELDARRGAPVTVTVRARRHELDPRQAGVRVRAGDLEAAVAAERERGWFGSRVWRRISGAESDIDLPAETEYDAAAVDRFVARIARRVERPAVNATVALGGNDGVRVRRGRAGRELTGERRLRERVVEALLTPEADPPLRARTRRVEPRVGTAELARRYPTVLVVDRDGFRLKLYKRLRLERTYGIAVGKAGLDTPAGRYEIANKAVNPAWHVPNSDWAGDLAGKVIPGGRADNPIRARWLGIYDGVGIHGTDAEYSIGSRASHGCIRMRVADVVALYDRVPVGTPIYIL